MDNVDFATVRASFNKRLQAFEKRKKTKQKCPQSPSRAISGSNSGNGKSMDGHAGRQSPSFEALIAGCQFTQQCGAPETCSQCQTCNSPPLHVLNAHNMRAADVASSTSLPDAQSTNEETEQASTSSMSTMLPRRQDAAPDTRSAKQPEL